MISLQSSRLVPRRVSRQSQNSSRVRGCPVLPAWPCSLRLSQIRFTRLRQAWWIGKSISSSASMYAYTEICFSLPSVVGISGYQVYPYCQFAGGEMNKSGTEETLVKSGSLYSVSDSFAFKGNSLLRFPPSTDHAKSLEPLFARLAHSHCTGSLDEIQSSTL